MNNYALVTYPSVLISRLWDFSTERILSVHLSGSQNSKWLNSTRSCSPNCFKRLQHPSNPTLYELFSLSAWSTILLSVYNSIHCSQAPSLFTASVTVQSHSLFTIPFTVTVHNAILNTQSRPLVKISFPIYSPILCSKSHSQFTVPFSVQNHIHHPTLCSKSHLPSHSLFKISFTIHNPILCSKSHSLFTIPFSVQNPTHYSQSLFKIPFTIPFSVQNPLHHSLSHSLIRIPFTIHCPILWLESPSPFTVPFSD